MCLLPAKRTVHLFPILFLLLSGGRLQAQEEVIPILRGEVRVGEDPLSEGYVVLHQVSAESSGEIDSVRVGEDGSFRIRLPHVPDHATRPDIFFASVQYRGLLYFGQAVTEAFQLDSLYLIQAYDTLSVPSGGARIPLAVRNLVLEKEQEGWAATDIFQLRLDGDRTLYSPTDGVVWAYPLPQTATAFAVAQADMAPDAIRFENGRLEVLSPLPPGERYLIVRYRVPGNDLVVPMPGRTDRMEILVREPAPAAEFPPLSLLTPVELEAGNPYRRYGADSLIDREVRAEIAPDPWSLPAEWLGLAVAGLLGAAGVFGFRRRSRTVSAGAGAPVEASRERLLQSVAQLDEGFLRKGNPSGPERAAYEARRKKLLSDLKGLS